MALLDEVLGELKQDTGSDKAKDKGQKTTGDTKKEHPFSYGPDFEELVKNNEKQ